jgi:hypothetical protein
MKTRWWMSSCAAGLLALGLTGSAALGLGMGGKKDEKAENRGQSKKEYRQLEEKQRQYAQTYYDQHQSHKVFRADNRWKNDYETRLQPGYVLDSEMRRMSRPAPRDMIIGLGRAPRGYRYIVIGGHVILVDNAYRVHDTVRIQLNFGH